MKKEYFIPAFLIILLALLVFPSTAAAAETRYVSPGESIQVAIDAANPGDTIIINGGEYAEAIEITKNNLTIASSGGTVKLYGDNRDPVITFSFVSDITLSGLAIMNADTEGRGGGLKIGSSSNITVTNCWFMNNKAKQTKGPFMGLYIPRDVYPSYGGGAYVFSTDIEFVDCTFYGNNASYGGAAYVKNCPSASFTRCTFSRNTAGTGGGVYILNSPTSFEECEFTGGFAYLGGGVYIQDSSPSFRECNFGYNYADYAGGAIAIEQLQTFQPELDSCYFLENEAHESGGAIFTTSGLKMNDCSFERNNSNPYAGKSMNASTQEPKGFGGAVYAYRGVQEYTGCTFDNNTAHAGGAIWSRAVDLRLTDTFFSGNTATKVTTSNYGIGQTLVSVIGSIISLDVYTLSKTVVTLVGTAIVAPDDVSLPWNGWGHFGGMGGAIYSTNSHLTVSGGTVADNAAAYEGGGIYSLANAAESHSGRMTNVTLERNSAEKGGALFIAHEGFEVDSCSFTRNRAEAVGGGILSLQNSHILDSYFSQNTAMLGGGMGNFGETCTGLIENCSFSNNRAHYGGAMDASGCETDSGITVYSCIFTGNGAVKDGAAVSYRGSKGTVSNSLFEDNSSTSDSGACYTKGSVLDLINCTITENSGSPVKISNDSLLTVCNSILWNNGNQDRVLREGSTGLLVQYTNSGELGSTNLYADPKFIADSQGNYQLALDSPCLDAGLDSTAVATLDLKGDTRIQDGNVDGQAQVDMGAFETRFGIIIDMGTDETIEEGEVFERDGSFRGLPGASYTATVDYGDGTGQQVLSLEQDKTFNLEHLYTGVLTDNIIKVNISNDLGDSGEGEIHVLVEKLPPQVVAGGNAVVSMGAPFDRTVSISDYDHSSWSVEVDYGDGSDHGLMSMTGTAQALDTGSVYTKDFDLNHPYTQAGTYTVTIKGSGTPNASDSNSLIGEAQLTVNVINPVPQVNAGQTLSISKGDNLTRVVTFSDPDSHSWTGAVDYGDGTPEQSLGSTQVKSFGMNHTYAQAGNFTLTVKVMDSLGHTGVGRFSIKVTDYTPLVEAGPDTELVVGGTLTRWITFASPRNNTSGTYTKFWTGTADYGDNTVSIYLTDIIERMGGMYGSIFTQHKVYQIQHTFIQAGTYTVTAVVRDVITGDIGQDTFTVTVMGPAPKVELGETINLTEGDLFTESITIQDPDSISWEALVDYGDGTGEQELVINADKTFTLNHIYEENGTYTIRVRIQDGEGNTGEGTLLIDVNNSVPVVLAGPDIEINEGDTLIRTGSFTDPGADKWTATLDYNNSLGPLTLELNSDKTFIISHRFSGYQLMSNIKVKVWDDEGAVGEDSFVVRILNVPPQVEAGPDTLVIRGTLFPREIVFTDPGWDSWTAQVDYGDGTVQEIPLNQEKIFNLSHIYDTDGTYPITVTVTDSDGGVGSDSFQVRVKDYRLEVEAGEDREIPEGSPFNNAFEIKGPREKTSQVLVDYGDGEITEHYPVGTAMRFVYDHIYGDDGIHDVTVNVSDIDGDCYEDTTKITVTNVAPVVNAGSGGDVSTGETFNSYGSFSDPGNDKWKAFVDYGDNSGKERLALNKDKSYNLSHSYFSAGTYTVTVWVSDDDGGIGQGTACVWVRSRGGFVSIDDDPGDEG